MTNQIKYEQLEEQLNLALNHLSHAYLFVTNNNTLSEKIIYRFIKNIFTIDETKENKNQIIKAIDDKNFSELKEIRPDGMWIKKDQMISLKSDFKTKSLNAKKRIYVIHEANKLNQSSSNSVLKFLEEPEDDIIAILITNNLGGVLDTIVSRCQIINIPKDNNIDKNIYEQLYFVFKNIIEKEEYEKEDYGINFIKNTFNFILKLEEQKEKMICFSREYFHNIFKKREEVEACFQIMILVYKDAFSYKISNKPKFFNNFKSDLIKIDEKNTKNSLIDKINILLNKKDLIKNNINVNLLIDSLIFEFEGVNL